MNVVDEIEAEAMKKPHWSRKLNRFGACSEAVEWAATQSTPAAARTSELKACADTVRGFYPTAPRLK